MAVKPHRNAAPRWKPPVWLLVADTISLALLVLGLLMQFAPDASIAKAMPPEAKLPLLVVGGIGFALCWVALAMSVIGAQRSR